MKRSADQRPVRISDHAAFFSYRWLAWAVAALALTLPGRPVETLPRDAGLLLLCGVINVVATALAQSYVRIARQRPLILGLDLVAGAAVLWLSGSLYLPFMPYALAALILPALLFGWRVALGATLAFIALDLLGLLALNGGAGQSGAALALRPLVPLAFTALTAALWRALAGARGKADPQAAPVDRTSTLVADRPDDLSLRPGQPPRPSDRPRSEPSAPGPANQASAGALLLMRPVAEQRPDAPRHLIYDPPSTQAGSLLPSLEQLGARAARHGELEVAVSCSGTPRPLALAQQSLLLRIAHEGLLNVQQHARAHIALLTLAYEADVVTLTIQDDGVGLLDGTYERPGLHALRALRYRLAELEGQLAVYEPERGGVTVRATIPFEP